ncbi:MAG: response regulator [Chloroflexota bacterium]
MPYALIIDDNPMNLETLSVLLRKEGLTPVTLDTPRALDAAIEKVDTVHVVFLDLEFPNYSGLDLVADMQAHPRLQGVPVVAYTVHTSEQNEARDAGFHSFIGKPLNVERFPDQLKRILEGVPVWEAG